MILFQQKTALWFPACKVPILWANKSILMTAAVHLYSVCVCVCMIAVTPVQVNLLTCLYPCDMLCITHALGASNQLEMWCVTFMRPLSFPSFDPGLRHYQHIDEEPARTVDACKSKTWLEFSQRYRKLPRYRHSFLKNPQSHGQEAFTMWVGHFCQSFEGVFVLSCIRVHFKR